jgi:hypothetical protein
MAESARHGRRASRPVPQKARLAAASGRRTQPAGRTTSGRYGVQTVGHGVRTTRRVERGGHLPWPARFLLVMAILALSAGVVLAGSGALQGGAAALGQAFGRLVGGVLGDGPASTPSTALQPPRLFAPSSTWTSQGHWDLRGRLPSGVAGRAGLTIRVFVNGQPMKNVPVPTTADFLVEGVAIPRGTSQLYATIRGPVSESEPSLAIEVTFDDVPPELHVAAPTDGAKVNGTTVVVKGRTQPGSVVSVRNERTATTGHGTASESGSFEVTVAIGKGTNGLTVTSVDPAGNATSTVVSILQGDGKLTANLSLSAVRIRRDRLPTDLEMTVRVLDPDGRPVEGARAIFTLAPPGQPTETFETQTVAGTATMRVSIPRDGTLKSSGLVTVQVILPDGRTVSDHQAFTIV